MVKILVDTNILVYIADKKDLTKYQKAREVLKEIEKNPENFTIGLQNLREFGNVLCNKTKIPAHEINEYIFQFQNIFSEAFQDDIESMQQAVFLNRELGVSFHDANLMRAAIKNGTYTIYTENTKDFEKIPGIRVVNPLN